MANTVGANTKSHFKIAPMLAIRGLETAPTGLEMASMEQCPSLEWLGEGVCRT